MDVEAARRKLEVIHREMRLLPALAAHVSFRVPLPVAATDGWFVCAAARAGEDEEIPGAIADLRRRLDRRPGQ